MAKKTPIQQWLDSFLSGVQTEQQAVTNPNAGTPADPNLPIGPAPAPVQGPAPYGSPWPHPGAPAPVQGPAPYGSPWPHTTQAPPAPRAPGVPSPAPAPYGSPWPHPGAAPPSTPSTGSGAAGAAGAGAPFPTAPPAGEPALYSPEQFGSASDIAPEPVDVVAWAMNPDNAPYGVSQKPDDRTLGGEVRRELGQIGPGIAGAWAGYMSDRSVISDPKYAERSAAIADITTAPFEQYGAAGAIPAWYQREVVAPVTSGQAWQTVKQTPIVNEVVRTAASVWGGVIPIFEIFDTLLTRYPVGMEMLAVKDNPDATTMVLQAALQADPLSLYIARKAMQTEAPDLDRMLDVYEERQEAGDVDLSFEAALTEYETMPWEMQVALEVMNPLQFDTGILLGAENVASVLRRGGFQYAQGVVKPMTKFDAFKLSFWDSFHDLPIVGYDKSTRATKDATITKEFASGIMIAVQRETKVGLLADPKELAAAYNRVINAPEVLFGEARLAPAAMRNLKRVDTTQMPAYIEAVKVGKPVNVPKFMSEMSLAIDASVYDSHGLIRDGKLFVPFSVRVANNFRAVESLPWLGTPSYVFNNAASGHFNALTGGIWMYGDYEGVAKAADTFPIPDRVMKGVTGEARPRAGAFAQYIGADSSVSKVIDKVPILNWYYRKIKSTASEGLIKNTIPVGEETMYTAQWSRLVQDFNNGLWSGGGPSRGTSGFNMVPPPPGVLPDDVATATDKTMRRAPTYQGGLDSLRADMEGRSVSVGRWLDDDIVHLSDVEVEQAQKIVDDAMKTGTPDEAIVRARDDLRGMQREARQMQDIAEANDAAPVIPRDYEGTPAGWAEQMAEHVNDADPGSAARAERVTGGFNEAISRLFEAASDNLESPYLSTTMRQAYLDILDHWHKSYMGGDVRLKNVWDDINTGMPTNVAWPNYQKDTGAWWDGRLDGLGKLVDDNIEYMRRAGAGEVPVREDFTDSGQYFDNMIEEMELSASAAHDPEFHRDVVKNRGQAMEARLMSFNDSVAEFDKTKDARFLGWYSAAVAEDTRITGKAVAHVAEQRAKMLAKELPLEDYYLIRDKLWRDLAHDTRGVYDDLRISIGLGDQAPSYVDLNKNYLTNKVIEETNRPQTIRAAAELADIDVEIPAKVLDDAAQAVSDSVVEPAIPTEVVEPAVSDSVVEPAIPTEVVEPAVSDLVVEPAVGELVEMRKAASESGVATATDAGVKYDYHLTNTINKALRESGLPEIPGRNLADNTRNIREMTSQQWTVAIKDMRARKAASDAGLDYEAIHPSVTKVGNVEQLQDGFRLSFGVSAQEAESMGSVTESRARVWAKQTGRNPEEYIPSHFASFETGLGDVADVGDDVLYQAGFAKRKPAYPWKSETYNKGERRYDDAKKIAEAQGIDAGRADEIAEAFGNARGSDLEDIAKEYRDTPLSLMADRTLMYDQELGSGVIYPDAGRIQRWQQYAIEDWKTISGKGEFPKFESPSGTYTVEFDPNDNWVLTKGEETKQSFRFLHEAQLSALDDAYYGNTLFQSAGAKASVKFLEDGRAIMRGMKSSDVSSMVHEVGHVFFEDLQRVAKDNSEAFEDMTVAWKWIEGELYRLGDIRSFGNLTDMQRGRYFMDNGEELEVLTLFDSDGKFTRAAHEVFASGFEEYLATGRAPTEALARVFDRFKEWLANVYGNVRESLGIEVSPEMRQVFDRMLAEDAGALAVAREKYIPPPAPPVRQLVTPPVKVQLPTAKRGVTGNTNLAWMDPNRKYEFEYELVERSDLIVSHSPEGVENKEFPQEFQNRNKTLDTYVVRTQQIAQTLDPAEVAGTTTALDRGMPIVGSDNVVLSGNTRVNAIAIAPSEVKDGYKNFVITQASELGIDAKTGEEMTDPVLVRRLTSEVDDMIAFVEEANSRANMALNAAESAQQQGRLLTFSDFDIFQLGSARTLTEAIAAPRNKNFAIRFVKRLPATEQARFTGSRGLTSDGVDAVRNAMFARVYGMNQGLVDNFVMSSQPEMANIGRGIEHSLPGMGRIAAGIEEGVIAVDYAIADDIAAAAQTMIELRKPDSAFSSVDEYLAQGRLFGDDTPEIQKMLLRMFEENKFSGKRIGDILNDYVDGVMVSGRTGKLLDTQGKDALAIMSEAIRGPQMSFLQNGMPPVATGARYTTNGKMRDIQRMIDNLDDIKRVGDDPLTPDQVEAFMAAIDDTYQKPYVQAKMLASRAATEVAEFNMLNYGMRTQLDNLIGMIFPYHYWYTRTGWNWMQRFVRRPVYLMWWLKSNAYLNQKRDEEPGLRTRYQGKYKVSLPDGTLPEGFEDVAYMPHPITTLMPFSNFINRTNWDDTEEANTVFQKLILASESVGLRPHMGLNFYTNEVMGRPQPGARDLVPGVNFLASAAGLLALAIPGAIPPFMGKAWSQWGGYAINRSVASAAAAAMRVEGLDYANASDVLAEAQRRGETDTEAVQPYIEAEMMIEDWYHGRLTEEEEEAMFNNEIVVEAFRAAGFEKALPGTIGFFGSMFRPMLIQEGEREQVLLKEASDAAKYDEATGEGSRADYQSITGAFPEVKARWAQYGTIPGEEAQSAEAIYWRMDQNRQRDEINTSYDSDVQKAIENDPANHEKFRKIQSDRFDELNAIEDNVPKDPDKPSLWSTAGANPAEVIEIRSNQILKELWDTRPQWDDFPSTSSGAGAWGEAMDEWYADLVDIAENHKIIQEAVLDLGDRGPDLLEAMTTRESMDLWSRRRHEPFQALHETIWAEYKEPYRLRREEAERRFPGVAKANDAFMAEAKTRYGDEIFNLARGYYSEIFGRYGQDIFKIQTAYFDQLEIEFGPNIKAVNDGYFASGAKGSDGRRGYIALHPELPQYWERKTQLLNQAPMLRQYWNGKDAIKERWGVTQYLSEKQLLEDKHGVSEYRDSLREIAEMYPAIEGGDAASFVDAVLERYPFYEEQGFTREVLLEIYKDVGRIPDADGIWIINEAERRDVDVSIIAAERGALEFLKGSPMPPSTSSGFGSAYAGNGYSPYTRRGSYGGGGGGGGGDYIYMPSYRPRRRDTVRLR